MIDPTDEPIRDPESTPDRPPPAGPASSPSGEDPGHPVPDAPLFALLRSIAARVEIDRIDRVWIFPPRRIEAGETAVVVVAAYPDVVEDRRRVYAAHYTAPADATEPRLALAEYGTAPTERIGRLVEDVVDRLKEEPAAPPRSARIEADPARWDELLHELAEQYLEQSTRNPRLGR